MYKPLAFFVGIRYLRAKRRNHFISFISLTSMLGISLGIWALVTVLSVMNGFEKELRERILGMASHATIEAIHEPLKDWKTISQYAKQHPNVLGVAPYIEGQVMLNKGTKSHGVLIRGISPIEEPNVSDISRSVVKGSFASLTPKSHHIIIGYKLAEQLNLDVGDHVTLIVAQSNQYGIQTLPLFKKFTITGVFKVGMYEYDLGLAYMHVEDAASLYQMGDLMSGIRLKLDNLYIAPKVVRELVRDLPGGYILNDWTRRHANVFSAIDLQKKIMFLILFLIITVAAFNIVSTLVMVVTDKQSDIAILRTMGASPMTIMKIFIVQGTLIGIIGTLIGVVVGIPTALNVHGIVSFMEQLFGVSFLPPDIYPVSTLTSELQWHDVGVVAVGSLLISLLATVYPAWRAARNKPAEALHYS